MTLGFGNTDKMSLYSASDSKQTSESGLESEPELESVSIHLQKKLT